MAEVVLLEERGEAKRAVVKYSALERLLHLVHLVSFVVLALTGLALTYRSAGWAVYLFGSYAAVKAIHHLFAWIFVISAGLFFLKLLPHARFAPYDAEWISKLGGYLDRSHRVRAPAGRVNAGQKLFFWFVLLGIIVLAITGFVIMYTPAQPGQALHLALHDLAAGLVIAAVLVHLYLTTIANPGTFWIMITGQADEDYIREHNPQWYEELKEKGLL